MKLIFTSFVVFFLSLSALGIIETSQLPFKDIGYFPKVADSGNKIMVRCVLGGNQTVNIFVRSVLMASWPNENYSGVVFQVVNGQDIVNVKLNQFADCHIN